MRKITKILLIMTIFYLIFPAIITIPFMILNFIDIFTLFQFDFGSSYLNQVYNLIGVQGFIGNLFLSIIGGIVGFSFIISTQLR